MTYIPHTEAERTAMLTAAGAASLDDLFKHLPEQTKCGPLEVPPGLGEMELSQLMSQLADRNQDASKAPCFLGAGAYDHFIPPAVMELIGRGELYTAYTPYQPEISQGVLQIIYEYQSMIANLCGCDVANASLYDGATALVEGCQMAMRHTRREKRVLLDGALHPHYIDTVKTTLEVQGVTVDVAEPATENFESDLAALAQHIVDHADELACVAVGYPNFFGSLRDFTPLIEQAHEAGVLVVAVSDPFVFGLVKPAGSPKGLGADIVCGEAQALGVPLQFGGPYLGYVASSQELVRRMPGRLVGRTVDVRGQCAYTLTLQAREQHIRREKATSNICTNEALCAMMAHFYMSCLGRRGLRRAGELCVSKTDLLRSKLAGLSDVSGAAVKGVTDYPVFHEFVYETRKPAKEVLAKLQQHGMLGGLDLGRYDPARDHQVLVCATEKRTTDEIERYVAALAEA